MDKKEIEENKNKPISAVEMGSGSASDLLKALPDSATPPDSTETPRRQRIIIKVGTSSLVTDDEVIDHVTGETTNEALFSLPKIAAVVDVVCTLRRRGYDVVLVSSGAVGAGALHLKLKAYPKSVTSKQALAAVGQVHILSKYESMFATLNQPIAQVLLTYGNLGNRTEYLNAENTFKYLLEAGVVPVVNENDTVATQFLRFGDNDRLSAMVASLLNADWLFMLTDVDGLYTDNPNTNPDAKRIEEIEDISKVDELCTVGSAGSAFGTGGMRTKIFAAQIATLAGANTVILHARSTAVIPDIIARKNVPHGTLFHATKVPLRGRKKWIRALKSLGTLYVDDGAVKALGRRKSLFAAGVTRMTGSFRAGERVSVIDNQGNEVAVGLANFTSDEMELVLGKSERQIKDIFGFAEPAIDRGNMVVTVPKEIERQNSTNTAYTSAYTDEEDD
jgi:glutamate 5-kinase